MMKKTIVFILEVILVVLLVDVAFGLFCGFYIKKKGMSGDFASIDYVIRHCDEDIVFLGSSVVVNSIIPQMLEDSLHVTCYNGGANGQLLPFTETMVDCILSRYKPRFIVFGVRPDELFGKDVGERYKVLNPYYGMGFSMIDSCLCEKNKSDKFLLYSNLYKYNTIWWRMLLNEFVSPDETIDKGYIAKELPLEYPKMMKSTEIRKHVEKNRKKGFCSMIDKCRENGVEVIVFFPPELVDIKSTPDVGIKTIEKICREKKVLCLNDLSDSVFMSRNDWFYDNLHLNKNGAVEYTKQFIKETRTKIVNDD